MYIIIYSILVLLVLLIVAKKRGWIGKSSAKEIETAKVSRETITETVNASGKVQPEKEVKISADISGEIIELGVKEGDRVKRGQLLVRIKPDEYQRGVERARAGVNSAQASLSNAKAQYSQAKAGFERSRLIYNRNKTLFEQKAISPAEFENIEADFNIAKAQLEGANQGVKGAEYALASSRASLQEAEDALRKTAVYAPIEGTITGLQVELGERVVGTMQMAGTEMMRISDLGQMEVEVEVNENDIVRLKLNDTADIDIDAYRGETFKGVVTEISNSAQSSELSMEKVTNFKVKIRVLESSYKHLLKNTSGENQTPFRPGMSANVAIQTKKVSNVLAVPILAVTVRSSGNETDTSSAAKDNEVVFIIKDGKAEQRVVKTGIQDDVHIEILNGLKEGEEVASGPYSIVSKVLQDGELVQKAEENGKKD
ncbi:MAG: efflux RND transporter periplasmic adaptor subunit [Chitinophagaceae bacterium]|nr:MAG: efflux RND transporter periplasmic adaptor subunit [Chitinophagaceae bacterium]